MTFRIVKPSNIWDQLLITSRFEFILKNSWFPDNLIAKIITLLYILLVAFYFITVFIAKYRLNAALNLAPYFIFKLLNHRYSKMWRLFERGKNKTIK